MNSLSEQCGCSNTCGCNEKSSCESIIWIILLLCLCGGNHNGRGNSCGFGGNGSGCESLIWILLLCSCCGGNSFC